MKPFKFRPKRNIDGPGGCNNSERAKRAENTLRHYFTQELHGPASDKMEGYNLADLIADLGHLADKRRFDFNEVAASALRRWEEER